MRKQWLGICIAAGMLAACTSDDGQQQTVSVPQPAVCNGPIVCLLYTSDAADD